ncbi:immunity 49 family protein [Nocardiopsis sp. B62]|uniref:immunity 49 family protein n=1 Tax=Nocardiopsis sp. B62 TaxID=2824874 RepID=UPI001FFDCB52|nr:immunity 49 family protein [Nocardiopsis sp. B62]
MTETARWEEDPVTLRIERHEVDDEAIAMATKDFTDRIGEEVRMEQHSGRSGFGWDMISQNLRDYAAARSVRAPHAEADVRAALYSAAEARVGAIMLEGAPTSAEFSVHLTYTGTGIFYQDFEGEDARGERPVPLGDWTEALYLCVLANLHENYESPLVQCASAFGENEVLQRALVFYLYPHLGAEREQLEGYVWSALGPLLNSLDLDSESDRVEPGSIDHGLLFLRALLARDQEAFWATMAVRLTWLRDHTGERGLTGLFPLTELAFAALAVRVEGWEMPFDSDYLPRYLVEGPGSGGRRVGPCGEDKDPEALAVLEHGSLVVERPTRGFSAERSIEEMFGLVDGNLERVRDPRTHREGIPDELGRAARTELLVFRLASVVDQETRHPRQLAALDHAAQYMVALFACAEAEGDTVEVTIGDTTVPMRSFESESAISGEKLREALQYALVAGSREHLEYLLAHVEDDHPRKRGGFSVLSPYGSAFLAYLVSETDRLRRPDAGSDPRVEEKLGRALEALVVDDVPGSAQPPVVLLSQLVAGDRDGFDLALADTLERHRDAYGFGERARDTDGLIDFDTLALACLASAKGWPVRVRSGYLPQGVLDRAAAMFA